MAAKSDDENEGSAIGGIAGCGLGMTSGLIGGLALTAATGGAALPLIPVLMTGGAMVGTAQGSENPKSLFFPAMAVLKGIFGGS